MPTPSRPRTMPIALVVGMFIGGWALLIGPGRAALSNALADRAAQLARFDDPDPAARKQAAWDQLPTPAPAVVERMTAGLLGGESDPDVRAAFAYTLGRAGDRSAVGALEQVLDTDPAGLVRCEAWLAIARIDPAHCRTLLAAAAAPRDAWDRLSQVQAAVACGQTDSIRDLIDLAEGGRHEQRVVAGRAIVRQMLPLLDLVGRWPLSVSLPGSDEPWSPAQIAALRQASEGLDFVALRRHLDLDPQAVAACRHSVERVYRGRAWLHRRLFGS